MIKNEKRHRITISLSNDELEALEDSLVAWNLCKKHNAQTWSPKTGERTLVFAKVGPVRFELTTSGFPALSFEKEI